MKALEQPNSRNPTKISLVNASRYVWGGSMVVTFVLLLMGISKCPISYTDVFCPRIMTGRNNFILGGLESKNS